ncbi:GNAT family N-acetyltransferase [Hazenella sp. IB182357]|uniref:GNAT family N-acetyltransferase n=1 Tax=Polycladospora coralii TaxID=2771432 RepID=A0A926N7K7_9BACL|nr:GNAT family N-acetyltransferase [Polycladospora coralii]MBD1371496.1 GNAT family N-acetyltransferase [Polycladospora coralii]
MNTFVPELSLSQYMATMEQIFFVLTLEDGSWMAMATIAIRTDFSNSRYMWISELVVLPQYRSQGLGKILMEHIRKYAIQQQSKKLILYAGLQREQAHRFWTHHMGYVFKHEL